MRSEKTLVVVEAAVGQIVGTGQARPLVQRMPRLGFAGSMSKPDMCVRDW